MVVPSAGGYGNLRNGVAFGQIPVGGAGIIPSQGPQVVLIALPASVTSIAAFGDSIMAGTGASTTPQRWIEIFRTALGATILNQGIPGTVLQNSNGSGGTPLAQNGRDRFFTDLLGGNKRQMCVIDYGFNDLRYTGNPAVFNFTAYQNDFQEILNGLMLNGYTRDNIVIGTPYYAAAVTYSTGSAGFTGSNNTIHQAYDTVVTALAKEYGVYYFDVDSYEAGNGGDSLIGVDNIHPTDTGHAVIAAGMLQARMQSFPAPVSNILAATIISGQLDVSFTADANAINYDIQIGISGTYSFPTSFTSSVPSHSFAGISSGSYVARARANYVDGTHSPWAFYTTPVVVAGVGVPTIENVTTSSTGTTSATATISTGGTDRILILDVAVGGAASQPNVATVTDTSGLTWTKRANFNFGVAGALQSIERWWAYAPAQITNNIITMTGNAATTGCRIGAYSMVNVNLTTPFDPNVSLPATLAQTTATSASVNISTTHDKDMIITFLRAPASLGTVTHPVGYSTLISSGTAQDEDFLSVTSPQTTVAVAYSWTAGTTASGYMVDALQGS